MMYNQKFYEPSEKKEGEEEKELHFVDLKQMNK